MSARGLRVAVVQATGPFLRRDRCLEEAVRWIQEAGAQGARLVAFPEGFIPGHPTWYHFHPVTGKQSLEWAAELFANSVEVGGPVTDALCEAARRAGVHVVIGVCEREPGTTGTMYNTQLFIDDGGRILGKRQKLVPTVGERIVHAPGRGEMVPVFETKIGRLTGLLCGENANPLAIFALAAQGAQIHVACWPSHFSPNEHPMAEAVTFNTLSLSYKASCFVLNACGTITEEHRHLLPRTDDDRRFLADPLNGGGSSVIGATSRVLSGPMPGDEQGLLLAELDLHDCVRAKVVHDYSGHYNRADVFTLEVRAPSHRLLRRLDGAGVGL
ncbi:MAG TPA: carbon-nitrogen hydrolase family protein [Candidatus Dormibacteraeota bacterium]|nr:carbon-nitrogen hydrolase family protein [Candidatus Dormibacteraeota bacterium]